MRIACTKAVLACAHAHQQLWLSALSGAAPGVALRTGLQTLELTSDAVMSRDLSPLSGLAGLRSLQVTSFNDPLPHALPGAVLALTGLEELSLRTLSLNLIQARAGQPP